MSNAATVVENMREGFRACYNGMLGRQSNAQGSVRMTMRVNCHGRVYSIHAKSHGIDRNAVTCMFEEIEKAEFRPPEGGSAEINVPVTFVRP